MDCFANARRFYENQVKPMIDEKFTAFRELLLSYYPDRIWKTRIVNELHKFSAAMQVNYARCMTRKDYVTARTCREMGVSAAMEIFYLMRREYPPYYKWTYKRLKEMDTEGLFARLVYLLSETVSPAGAWEGKTYNPDLLNTDDPVVTVTEQIGSFLAGMLKENGLISGNDPYLERYVDEIIATVCAGSEKLFV